jgi:hypothetical protein
VKKQANFLLMAEMFSGLLVFLSLHIDQDRKAALLQPSNR